MNTEHSTFNVLCRNLRLETESSSPSGLSQHFEDEDEDENESWSSFWARFLQSTFNVQRLTTRRRCWVIKRSFIFAKP